MNGPSQQRIQYIPFLLEKDGSELEWGRNELVCSTSHSKGHEVTKLISHIKCIL